MTDFDEPVEAIDDALVAVGDQSHGKRLGVSINITPKNEPGTQPAVFARPLQASLCDPKICGDAALPNAINWRGILANPRVDEDCTAIVLAGSKN